jgi:hypothetical protein
MKIDFLVDVRSLAMRAHEEARLPVLERCLARGDAIAAAGSTYLSALLAGFGLSAHDAPCAALALAGDGGDPGSDYWLRADPICLQPTINRLTGGALADGELDWNEAASLAEGLRRHWQAEGFELIVQHPQRWYLRCPSDQALRTHPLPRGLQVLDESLLPTGADGACWQRRMTEAQMLLHAHAVNQAREAAGRPPANGVWIWGGGRSGTLPARPYALVCSDDALALGLAARTRAPALPPPAADALIERLRAAGGDGRGLLALSGSSAPDLPALESQWLAPLLASLRQKRIAELTLRLFVDGHVLGRRLTRGALRRWWRRPRALRQHAHA